MADVSPEAENNEPIGCGKYDRNDEAENQEIAKQQALAGADWVLTRLHPRLPPPPTLYANLPYPLFSKVPVSQIGPAPRDDAIATEVLRGSSGSYLRNTLVVNGRIERNTHGSLTDSVSFNKAEQQPPPSTKPTQSSSLPRPSHVYDHPDGTRREVYEITLEKAALMAIPCWTNDEEFADDDACIFGRPKWADHSIELLGDAVVTHATNLIAGAKDIRRLNHAVHLLNHVVAFNPVSDTLFAKTLSTIAFAFHQNFHSTGDVSKLDDAIERFDIALSLEPEGAFGRWAVLEKYGRALVSKYEMTSNKDHLDRAVEYLREGLSLCPDGTSAHAHCISTLGGALLLRYKMTLDQMDLDEATDHFARQLSVDSNDDDNRSITLSNLAQAFLIRFRELGGYSNLEQAILYLEEVVERWASDPSRQATALFNLSGAYVSRYNQTEDLEDLEKSIRGYGRAAELFPDDHPTRPVCLGNMAGAYLDRYHAKSQRADLDLAITYAETALSQLPPKYHQRQTSLRNLAEALSTRFHWDNDPSDLARSLVYYQEALSLQDPGHYNRAATIRDITKTLLDRHSATGDETDYTLAISQLSNLSPQLGDPKYALTMGKAMFSKFNVKGQIPDLDLAIKHFGEAMSYSNAEGKKDPDALEHLSIALTSRYLRTGNGKDLDRAINHQAEAITLRPKGSPKSIQRLDHLAHITILRFKVTRNPSDPALAIRYCEEALAYYPPGTLGRPMVLYRLASILLATSQEADSRHDLDAAIKHLEEAFASLPNNHSEYRLILNALATCLGARSKFSGNLSDLDQAVAYGEDALARTPTDDKDICSFHHAFGLALFARWELGGRPEDFRDAGVQFVYAVQSLPSDHNERAWYMLSCANMMKLMHLGTKNTDLPEPDIPFLDTCLSLLQSATLATSSTPLQRLEACCQYITLSTSEGRPVELGAYVLMLSLLDAASAQAESFEARQTRLWSDSRFMMAKILAMNGVSSAIEQGHVELAVEFLEYSKAILLCQLSRYRTSLDSLHDERPDLAERFKALSSELEHTTVSHEKASDGALGSWIQVDRHVKISSRARDLTNEWNDLVEEIRAVPGFEPFLKELPFEKLREAASCGPVILINISIIGSPSNALIVTKEGPPTVVPLPDADLRAVLHLVAKFGEVGKGSPTIARETPEMLRDLWDIIVEPIAVILQETLQYPIGSRIWWCPSMIVQGLPFHAAGIYKKGGMRMVDLYVSSYTSTLSTLIRAREGLGQSTRCPDVLVVGQSNTPRRTPLPAVTTELDRVTKRVSKTTVLRDEEATREAVLSSLPQHPWVHLSCHGIIGKENPLQSHFALHDGPLSLLDLMKLNLPHAELAFLSACHSAASSSPHNSDEFLHLAAAIQFAGFRSVVGTMWAMADEAGPIVAGEFYRKMLSSDTVDGRNAAWALREAVKRLRVNKAFSYGVWINFVHWGA
ncbi:hypothetical protein FRB99_000616 [Tulasnella sp. 403]|nr:hypothetical protein FRB99_000616 [Tulasnella sp. 403]